jgi:hypothetical protein
MSARCLGEPLPRRSGVFHHEHRGLVGVIVSRPDHGRNGVRHRSPSTGLSKESVPVRPRAARSAAVCCGWDWPREFLRGQRVNPTRGHGGNRVSPCSERRYLRFIVGESFVHVPEVCARLLVPFLRKAGFSRGFKGPLKDRVACLPLLHWQGLRMSTRCPRQAHELRQPRCVNLVRRRARHRAPRFRASVPGMPALMSCRLSEQISRRAKYRSLRCGAARRSSRGRSAGRLDWPRGCARRCQC